MVISKSLTDCMNCCLPYQISYIARLSTSAPWQRALHCSSMKHSSRGSRRKHSSRGSRRKHSSRGSRRKHSSRGSRRKHSSRGSRRKHSSRGSRRKHSSRGSRRKHSSRGSRRKHSSRGSRRKHCRTPCKKAKVPLATTLWVSSPFVLSTKFMVACRFCFKSVTGCAWLSEFFVRHYINGAMINRWTV